MVTHGAGVAVQKKTVTACQVTPEPTGQQAAGLMALQDVGPVTEDLRALSDWLAEAGSTQVARESPGEYWRAVYNRVEGPGTIVRVNAAPVKQGLGRTTDQADARWRAKPPWARGKRGATTLGDASPGSGPPPHRANAAGPCRGPHAGDLWGGCLTAVGRVLVVRACPRLARHEAYRELGSHDCDELQRAHRLARVPRRLQRLG
jgi:hypothetical protein